MNHSQPKNLTADWLPAYFSLVTALLATSGSLFFSEIMKLPPCILCWYQRIAMYPLIIIIAIGIILQDKKFSFYSVILSIIGLAIAFYHNLLYYHIIPESLSPCVQGISCTSRQIEWFGFITIPLLSLISFILISVFLIYFIKTQKIISKDHL